MKRKGLLGAGVILAGAYFGVGNYFYNYALNAKKKKTFLQDNPHLAQSVAIDPQVEAAAKKEDQIFLAKHPPVDKVIVSNDDLGLLLHADYYPSEESISKWAVVLHGYTGQSAEMVRWIRGFHEQGFHVLAPDLRGHGKSEGNYIGMGWHDRKDILSWLDFILYKDGQAEIALFGLSMGAATVMMTAGEELPDNVKVIVEDCGYSTVRGVFTHQLQDLFGLPPFPVMNAANSVTKLRADYDLYQASSVKQVSKSKTPMLFIHGDRDSFVPFEMLNEVYSAAKVEKEQLTIPGAGHGECVKVAPDLYWEKVHSFVGRYI